MPIFHRSHICSNLMTFSIAYISKPSVLWIRMSIHRSTNLFRIGRNQLLWEPNKLATPWNKDGGCDK